MRRPGKISPRRLWRLMIGHLFNYHHLSRPLTLTDRAFSTTTYPTTPQTPVTLAFLIYTTSSLFLATQQLRYSASPMIHWWLNLAVTMTTAPSSLTHHQYTTHWSISLSFDCRQMNIHKLLNPDTLLYSDERTNGRTENGNRFYAMKKKGAHYTATVKDSSTGGFARERESEDDGGDDVQVIFERVGMPTRGERIRDISFAKTRFGIFRSVWMFYYSNARLIPSRVDRSSRFIWWRQRR